MKEEVILNKKRGKEGEKLLQAYTVLLLLKFHYRKNKTILDRLQKKLGRSSYVSGILRAVQFVLL